MNITLRTGRAEDARACATICYEAFTGIAGQHNFPPKFLPLEAAVAYIGAMIANKDVYTVVAETNAGLQALIGAAATLPEPGWIVPPRNAGLLRWCLDNGLRITAPMTLMSRGLYNEPTGTYLPSVLY